MLLLGKLVRVGSWQQHPLDPQPFPATPLSSLVLQPWHSSASMETSQQCTCGHDTPPAPLGQGTLRLSPLLTPHLRVLQGPSLDSNIILPFPSSGSPIAPGKVGSWRGEENQDTTPRGSRED